MRKHKKWIRGLRWALLALMLWVLIACSKEESPRIGLGQPEPQTVVVPAVPTQTPVETPALEETTAAEIAVETLAEEAAIVPSPEAEDIPTTEPLLILSGRVTLQDGSPATGTVVQLSKPPKRGLGRRDSAMQEVAKATVDENGWYRLVVGDQAFFFLTASRKGSKEVTLTIPDQRVRRGEEQTGIREITRDIVLLPVVSIRGRVVDESDEPITSIEVTAVSLEQQHQRQVRGRDETTTDEHGRFFIDEIAVGEVILLVRSRKYVPLRQVVSAPAEGIVLRLSSEGAVMEGRVFLKSTGEPVSRALVQMHLIEEPRVTPFSPVRTVTDEFGAFRFERLAAGTYEVRAEKDDLFLLPPKDSRRHHIVVAEKEIKAGIELFLYPGHTIQGEVTFQETGEPLEGVKVGIVWGADRSTDETDANGAYMLTGLSQTNIALRVEKEGYVVVREDPRDPFVRVEFTPDNFEVTKNIEMQRAATISGTVKTADGLPVSDARVCLYSRRNWSRRTQFTNVDEFGSFTLEVEPFSSCRVKAEAPGYAVCFSDVVEVQDIPVKDVNIILKQGASVMGTVVGPDGQFVEGSTVWATQMSQMGNLVGGEKFGETKSDTRGNFTLFNLPAGEVRLTAQKDGFASSRKTNLVLSPGEVKSGVKLVLRQSQFLAGRITDPEGEPVAEVRVNAWSSREENSSGHTQTDDEGHYRIEGLADTLHNVNLSHRDYVSEMYPGIKVGRDDADFVLGGKPGVTFIGKVVDWKSGEPIANFTVSSYGRARVEKDLEVPGLFKAENLEHQVGYRFRIETPGYRTINTGTILLPRGREVVERTFEMGAGGAIVGRVISGTSKEPVPGVKIQLKGLWRVWRTSQRPPEATTTTGEDGYFHLESAAQGENTVVFNPPNPFASQTRTIQVHHGDVADFGDVEISGGGTIKGRVVQLPGATPVASIGVAVRPWSWTPGYARETETDQNGAFAFNGLSNGGYVLRLPEYDVSRLIQLRTDETQDLVLRIGAGVLKGVVLQNGQPVRAAVHLRQNVSERREHAPTDDDGRFEIKDLPPGRWLARVYSYEDGRWEIEEWIDISPDGVTEKVFEFPAGRIVGKVVDASEVPVANAKVMACRSQAADALDGSHPRTWTVSSQEDGAFAIENLYPDLYGVSASKEDLGIAMIEDVQVPHNADSKPVILRLGTEGGTLVSIALNLTNGEAMPDAWCYLTTSSGVRFDHGQKRDDKGFLRITNIPPGTYNAQVGASGFAVKEHTVEIKAGETVELTDALYEAGSLAWTIMDKSGFPLAHIDCRLVPNDPNSIEKIREGKTDANGLWIQHGLYPGEYTVTSRLSDGRKIHESITIKQHGFTQKEIIVD